MFNALEQCALNLYLSHHWLFMVGIHLVWSILVLALTDIFWSPASSTWPTLTGSRVNSLWETYIDLLDPALVYHSWEGDGPTAPWQTHVCHTQPVLTAWSECGAQSAASSFSCGLILSLACVTGGSCRMCCGASQVLCNGFCSSCTCSSCPKVTIRLTQETVVLPAFVWEWYWNPGLASSRSGDSGKETLSSLEFYSYELVPQSGPAQRQADT